MSTSGVGRRSGKSARATLRRDTRTPTSGSWCGTRSIICAPRHEGDRIRADLGRRCAAGRGIDRFVEFTGTDGKVCVRARTQWAIIDKALGRPIRVPPEVIAPFLAAE